MACRCVLRGEMKARPEVPTLEESDLPDFEVSTWFGNDACGLPPAIVSRIDAVKYRWNWPKHRSPQSHVLARNPTLR